ncbi:MAG: nucleotide exchange factor GrpE [Chitinophagaceae bacterium]
MQKKEQEPGFSDNLEPKESEQDFQEQENIQEAKAEEKGTEEEKDEISKVEELENQLQEQRDKYLRLVAEFDNFRKRIAREKLDLIQTANKDVIISLLDILDDCERATNQMEDSDDIDSVKEGAFLIFNKLKNHLQALGLKEMKSLHQDFDVELHDAITEVPAPSKDLKGKVIDNIQKGYYLNDKLIRHAKVVIGK